MTGREMRRLWYIAHALKPNHHQQQAETRAQEVLAGADRGVKVGFLYELSLFDRSFDRL